MGDGTFLARVVGGEGARRRARSSFVRSTSRVRAASETCRLLRHSHQNTLHPAVHYNPFRTLPCPLSPSRVRAMSVPLQCPFPRTRIGGEGVRGLAHGVTEAESGYRLTGSQCVALRSGAALRCKTDTGVSGAEVRSCRHPLRRPPSIYATAEFAVDYHRAFCFRGI